MTDDTFGKAAALSAAVSWAIGVPLLRRAAADVPPIVSCILRNLIAAAIMISIVLASGTAVLERLHELSLERHLLFLASAIIGISLADSCFFAGAKHLQIGVIGLTQTIYSPLVVTISALVLHERLSSLQLIGGALVIAATVLVNVSLTGSDRTRNERAGFLFMLGCVVSNVAAVLLVKVAIADFPVVLLAPYRLLTGVAPIFLWAVLQPAGSPVHQALRDRRAWLKMLPGAAIGTALSSSLWILGFQYTKASIAALINESSALFLLLVGWLFFHERLTPLKAAAALLAGGGLCLLWL